MTSRSLLRSAFNAFCAVALWTGIMGATSSLAADPIQDVYLGTYTAPDGSKGIYRTELNLATGVLSAPVLVAETINPSFLAIHPTGKYLYAANEVGEFEGKKGGGVTAFAIDANTHGLTKLNSQLMGEAPCHLVVDRTGKAVLVANYGGGNVGLLPIEADGRLKPASAMIQHTGSSVDPNRQKEPHAHSINIDAKNNFAVAADLGLDKLLVYRLDAVRGTLTPNLPPSTKVEPGAGQCPEGAGPVGGPNAGVVDGHMAVGAG